MEVQLSESSRIINKKEVFDFLVSKLERAKREIIESNKNTENKFLDIGQKLQGFLTGSKEITGIAGEAAGSIAEKVLDKGVAEITDLLTQLKQHFSDSISVIKKDKSELFAILKKIEVIIDDIGGFKKIVKHLKVLGISTKIEIARLGTDDKGFSALVQNVDRLSDVIEIKTGNISSKAHFLLAEINKTTNELSGLEIQQIKQSTVVLNSASNSLEGFTTQYNGNSKFVDNIFSNSKQITKNIGDIVVSIQFHDITRQQTEHVVENIDELLESMHNYPDESSAKEEEQQLGSIYDVCDLQSIQLRNSLNQFGTAVEEIISALSSVDRNFRDILNETEKLFLSDSNKESNYLDIVRKELLTIADELRKNAEVESKLYNSINSVVDVVEDLSKFVLEVETIGDEIEIIALNAIIKAAHVGNDGSALGILAESIQRLSIEAKEQTGSITEKLKSVNEIAQMLRLSLNNSSYEKSEELNTTNKNIKSLIDSIISVEGETKDLFVNLKSEIESLHKEISYTASKIDFHHLFINRMNEVIILINEIVNELHPHIKQSNERRINHQKIMDKYTMHSEREIHNRFSSSSKSLTVKKINKNKEPEEDSFGDNIELF